MRRDQRQRELARQLDQDLVERLLLEEAVVLQLDEERARLEAVAQRAERLAARVLALLQHLLREVAAHARRQADQALAVLEQLLEVDARLAVRQAVDPAAARRARPGSCSPPGRARAARGGAPRGSCSV